MDHRIRGPARALLARRLFGDLIPGAAASKANGGKKAKSATVKAKPAKAETCPICDFQTTPPHDGRAHRYQKKKAPLSAAELKDKGLTKV